MWKAVLWQGKGWDFGTVNRNRQEPDSLVFRSRLGFLLSVCLEAQGKLLHLFLLISPGEKGGTAKHQRRGKDSPSAHHTARRGDVGEWYTEPASVVCLLQEPFPIQPGNRTRAWGIPHTTRAILFHLISPFPCHRDCLSSVSDSTS